MTLEQLGAGIDFVSDSPPTNATDGDTFLDTSLSPPQVKVFDGSLGAFVRPQTAQNLDQQVSNAGATQSDISSGVDASTTASTVSNNLDAPVSNAGATQSDISSGVDASTTASTVSNNLDAPVSNAGADLRLFGGFQLSLAEFVFSFDVSGQDVSPKGMSFNADGTTMFILGDNNDSVFQYSLSSGFDVNTASFSGTSFDVSGQAGAPQGVTFNADGTTMFVVGSNDPVFQYSLSSGFDVNTASFSGTSFDVSGQDFDATSMTFNADGTTMFILGGSTDSVFQYSLSSGFDVNTASFSGTSFDVSGQTTDPTGVTFNADGTTMFVVGRSNDSVFQYSLSSGFDVNTASFSGTSFDVSGQDGSPQGVTFNADGTAMFVVGSGSDSVSQYLVGTVGPK
jgi:sugar lactone lactonase YvrE